MAEHKGDTAVDEAHVAPHAHAGSGAVARPPKQTPSLRPGFIIVLIVALAVFAAWQLGLINRWLSASPVDPAEDARLASTYYAYSTLDANDRERYRIVLDALQTREERAYPAENVDTFDDVYRCVMADHPELFYVESASLSYTSKRADGSAIAASVCGEFAHSEGESIAARARVDAAAHACLAGLPAGADNYTTAKYLYEWLADNVSYDYGVAERSEPLTSTNDAYTVIGALAEGRAVCDGYARAFQYLMQELGLPCVRVTGSALGEKHAWCMAFLDGAWYYIDPTWGDPQYGTGSALHPTDAGYVNYDFLNATTADLAPTHSFDGTLVLPECVANADNYYVREGLLINSESVASFDSLAAAVLPVAGTLQVRCTDEAAYQQLSAMLSTGSLPETFQTGIAFGYILSDEMMSALVIAM